MTTTNRRRARGLVLLFVLLSLGGCPDKPATDGDADTDADTDVDTDVDADADVDVDDACPDGSGDGDLDGQITEGQTVTFVVNRITVVTERLCDLDGDGEMDNSVANMGGIAAPIFASVFNNLINNAIQVGTRILVHFPWVDDVTTPHDLETLMLILDANDTDSPLDTSDDFSGEEPFYADLEALDGCGEPLFSFPDMVIDRGECTGTALEIPFPLSTDTYLTAKGVQASGEMDPGATEMTLTLCAYSLISDLGGEPGPEEAGGLSLLEVFLAGGAALGFPMLPGLDLDVDVDFDGLEQFELDSEGRIVACIDGNLSRIEGRDCWQNPNMADGFSLVLRIVASPAVFAGRPPGWRDDHPGTCDGGYPEHSLFDP